MTPSIQPTNDIKTQNEMTIVFNDNGFGTIEKINVLRYSFSLFFPFQIHAHHDHQSSLKNNDVSFQQQS